MNKNISLALAGVLISTVILSALLTGCSMESGVKAETDVQNDVKVLAGQTVIDRQDDENIRKLISEYFVKLYSVPVDDYQKNSESGSIPENLRDFIAKRTLDEGNNNVEVGLNFPRFIGLNGTTVISYAPVMKPEDDKEPEIESTFIQDNGETVLYFVKMNLKAKCIPDNVFETNYKLNAASNTYQKSADPEESHIDSILIQAKYDVELMKDGDEYKILRARESTFKQGAKNRLFRYNNDFITRLPYLDLTSSSDNTGYENKKDGETYTREKDTIMAVFENIINLDNERRILLSGSWDKGLVQFNSLMKSIGVIDYKDKKDILAIDDQYRDKLPKKALLLESDIYSTKVNGELKDVSVLNLHPAYSEKNKWYMLSFRADVDKNDGIAGNSKEYVFDYLVKLAGKDGAVKVETIKLNGITPVEKPAETSTHPDGV